MQSDFEVSATSRVEKIRRTSRTATDIEPIESDWRKRLCIHTWVLGFRSLYSDRSQNQKSLLVKSALMQRSTSPPKCGVSSVALRRIKNSLESITPPTVQPRLQAPKKFRILSGPARQPAVRRAELRGRATSAVTQFSTAIRSASCATSRYLPW